MKAILLGLSLLPLSVLAGEKIDKQIEVPKPAGIKTNLKSPASLMTRPKGLSLKRQAIKPNL